MKFTDIQIRSVYPYFLDQLKGLYSDREIRSLADLALQNYFGYSKAFIILNQDLMLSESDQLKLNQLVQELKSGKPIQYAMGTAHFMDMDLYVNEHCLIPRPETEELVNWITSSNEHKSGLNVLDIGCGSGCIALALKKARNSDTIYAVDVSEEALKVTKKNSVNLDLDIKVLQDDVLNPTLIKELVELDIIVSNPPYVLESEASLMHKNVLEYEPHLALFVAEEDALIFYKAITEIAKKNLKSGGHLYFEINEQYGKTLKTFLLSEGFSEVTLKKDLNNKDRMIRAQLL